MCIRRFVIIDSLSFRSSFQIVELEISSFIFYILLLDLVFYWRHRLYHRWLWSIHKLHHSDSEFDFSLSLRLHPLETCVQILLFFVLSILIKVPEWQFLLATQLFTFQALFSHLEFVLPASKLKLILQSVFVIAEDHRHHHHPERFNCNFGFLFSFWDRLFKTQNSI